MANRFSVTAIVFSIIIAAGIVIFSLSGFFVVPKYELATSCDTCVIDGEVVYPQTIWYWRGKSGYPFIGSDGGNLILLKGEGYSFADRVNKSVEMRRAAFKRKMIKFPYSEFLYKVTTGGRPPKKYDSAF